MRPLQTVFAYKDDGTIIKVPTRWSPRKVLCKETRLKGGASEGTYAVKYRRRNNRASNAAAISEIVCHALMRAVGLRMLDAVLVEISPELSQSYAQSELLDYRIDDGLHFGTRLRLDYLAGPVPEGSWELLARPEDLVSIWAADTWLMNLDREVHGNVLLELVSDRWHLIPADQSDCFLGAGALSDGSYRQRSKTYMAAPGLPMWQRVFLEKGPQPLQRMVGLIRQAKQYIPEAISRVPNPWWDKSGVRPDELADCLRQRADRIHALVDLATWEKMPYGPDGATILDL